LIRDGHQHEVQQLFQASEAFVESLTQEAMIEPRMERRRSGRGGWGRDFGISVPAVFTLCINELPSSATNDAAKRTGERWRRTFRATGPAKGNRQGHPVAGSGRKGRLIRHTFLRHQAVPAKDPLTVSMIESSLGALLVTPIR
jgi:hypothetical protein